MFASEDILEIRYLCVHYLSPPFNQTRQTNQAPIGKRYVIY